MKSKKFDFKKFTEFIKKRNFIIAIGVLALTGATLSVSYASFFSVKTNTNNQSITTGTLEVSFGSDKNASSSVLLEDMTPMSDEEGMAQEASNVIYIQNTGTLDSQFIMDIGYDVTNFKARTGYSTDDRLTPIEFIKFALYEYKSVDGSSRKQDVLISGPLTIADLIPNSFPGGDSNIPNFRYLMYFNTVGSTTSGNSTRTFKIKMWLSDKATPSISNTYFYVNTKVTAEVYEARPTFNLRGKLLDTNGNAISGGIFNFNHGSIVSITNSDGEFAIDGIPTGNSRAYQLDIIVDDYTNTRYLNFFTGYSSLSMGIYGSGSCSTNNIFYCAGLYGVTVNSILNQSNLTIPSDMVTTSDTRTRPESKIFYVTLEPDINMDIRVNRSTHALSTFTLKS